MNQGSANRRQDVDSPRPPPTPRNLFGRQDDHRCPYCSKAYRTSTWLENHIKIKHITAMTQEHSDLLAHMSNSNHNSTRNAMLLSQLFQELNRPAVTQNLATTVALLKQLVPLMEGLLPILEQLDEVSSSAPPMRRSNPLNPKRCASSPDLRGESGTKRRELSTSISEACVSGGQNESENYPDKTAALPGSAHDGDPHRAHHADSMVNLSKGGHFKLEEPAYSRSVPRHSHSGKTNSSQGLVSHSRTLYYEAPNGALPQRRQQLRPFQAPRIHGQSEISAQVPHILAGWYQTPPSPSERILYQELDQHQLALQGMQQDSSSPHQQASQHSFGDCPEDIFQDWNLPLFPNPGSSDSTMSAAQLMRNLDEGDDHFHLDHSSL